MITVRNLFLCVLLSAAAMLRADQPDKYTKPHEPFTAYGMQVRMSLIDPIDKTWREQPQPTVFQEIAPCRLTSTIPTDHYARPWGGPAFQANESRHYLSRGVISSVPFVNPCSEVIPYEAIGIVARFTVTPGSGDGEVRIDRSDAMSANAHTVFAFQKNRVLMFEAGVLFDVTGAFDVATRDAGADVMIDVLGYLLPDPAPAAGPKGDKGDQGEKGEKGDRGEIGPQGIAGPKGDQGEKGADGAIGPKGDKGADGLTGPKGDKGADGLIGPKGDKGDKGDTGAIGPKGDNGTNGANGKDGATGPKGDIGPMGPQGPKGDKGDKGDDGAAGPQGLKGDKGDQGPIGPQGPQGLAGHDGQDGHDGAKGEKGDNGDKGDRGEKGLQGEQGEKGEKGDVGPQGLIGPMGPQGPRGERGPEGICHLTVTRGGGCYPPGNNANSQVTIWDPAVSLSSIIMLNYTDAGSNGNALALTGAGNGYFETTGAPNRCFQYVVINGAQ